MNLHYHEVAERAGQRCEYCRAPEIIFNFLFEVDHIVPSADENNDEPPNLALACRACNAHKSDFTRALDPESGESVPLFHPRRDVWSEHFSFDAESLEIRGLTDVGRATVVRLKMNRASQITGRSFWVQLSLYP